MNLAGLQPVGALCEILDEDGTMARPPYLFRFARKHHLKVISIAQLIEHRFKMDKLVRRMTTTKSDALRRFRAAPLQEFGG